ncbi:MAG: acetylxylan esterase, partial [Acidobacteria bacterium]|nr:acetylxylan esterase [Acidobacteriota bacterium]
MRRRRTRRVASGLLCVALSTTVLGQERTGTLDLSITPDRADWTYAPGQPARFVVDARRDGHPVAGVPVTVRCGPEMLPPTLTRELTTGTTSTQLEGGTMAGPGFLRCVAIAQLQGRSYRAVGTAGFTPSAIVATVTEPADFD